MPELGDGRWDDGLSPCLAGVQRSGGGACSAASAGMIGWLDAGARYVCSALVYGLGFCSRTV